MTILEILEAHKTYRTYIDSDDMAKVGCSCGDKDIKRAGMLADGSHRAHLAEVLDKHMREREQQMRQLIRDMTDPGACWFDHHGGCQEHGYLSLEPGELCPHAEAKQLLGDESDGR